MGEKECSKCGECCSEMLPLTDGEVAAIEEYIHAHEVEPRRQSAYCPFLDLGSRLCRIYEIRPAICRICDCRQFLKGTLFTQENKEKLRYAKTVNMTDRFCGK